MHFRAKFQKLRKFVNRAPNFRIIAQVCLKLTILLKMCILNIFWHIRQRVESFTRHFVDPSRAKDPLKIRDCPR